MNYLTLTTDWIQAVGMILGFPAALWGMIMLFRKDKERQKEIDALASLATSQDKMIEKITERIEIEKKNNLDRIKPFFNASCQNSNPDDTIIKFVNLGPRAKIKGIEEINNHRYLFSIDNFNQYIEKDQTFNVKVSGSMNEAFFTAYIHYQDIDRNNYYQLFRTSSNKIYIEQPVLFSGNYSEIYDYNF
jgi:hypothetical protein